MSSPAAVGALASLCWFTVFLLLEAVTTRLRGGGAFWLVRNVAGCGTLLLMTLLLTNPARAGVLGTVLAVAFGGLVYVCLFVLYVPFLYTVRTSLSVQSMVLLLRYDGRFPQIRLFARFAGKDIAKERLAILAGSGYLVEQQGRFQLTSRGKRIATSFAAVKVWWKLGDGG
jgi:hypothetical protein